MDTIFRKILRKLPHCTWGGFAILYLLTACMADEEYSLSPADKLTFPTDTIAFDTIISGQPTSTYSFQIYNHNEKALRLPKIYLERGIESDFVVNIDGTYLENGSASDFEISGRDSLRGFVFVNTPQKTVTIQLRQRTNLFSLQRLVHGRKLYLQLADNLLFP